MAQEEIEQLKKELKLAKETQSGFKLLFEPQIEPLLATQRLFLETFSKGFFRISGGHTVSGIFFQLKSSESELLTNEILLEKVSRNTLTRAGSEISQHPMELFHG